jgi:hypothetical protein
MNYGRAINKKVRFLTLSAINLAPSRERTARRALEAFSAYKHSTF